MKIPFTKKKKKDSQSGETNDIRVKVYSRFGALTRHKRAEYIAKETKDEFGNLITINEKVQHDEDTDFSMDDIYVSMEDTFNVYKFGKAKAIEKIKAEIEKHKKRIDVLERFPELDVYSDYWANKKRLKQLNIFLHYLQVRSEKGTYFTIENGLRTYSFESIDGCLVPIWHDVDNMTDYPDLTRKKKIILKQTNNFQAYLDQKGTKKLMTNAFVTVLLITVIFAGGLMFGAWQVWNMHDEQIQRWEAPAQYCAKEMAESYSIFNQVMQNALIKDYVNNTDNKTRNEIQQKIKDLTPD